eukprot:TRINITY_DN8019_c0_g1_i2.p2 TRINITY_DN8019_c0_g1~~TRINITY_DN8019_c0_g1_i2.p2  ORF type:complete len:105 (+),score=2.56 TRINITY_DN8019_c0_g1_i2:338-652(+)
MQLQLSQQISLSSQPHAKTKLDSKPVAFYSNQTAKKLFQNKKNQQFIYPQIIFNLVKKSLRSKSAEILTKSRNFSKNQNLESKNFFHSFSRKGFPAKNKQGQEN